MLANEFIPLPYSFTRTRPLGSPSWGLAHKEFQRSQFKRIIRIMGPVQEMPVFDSRVRVDPKVKDHWGIPVVRLSGRRHPHDVEIAKFISGKAAELLKEAGATGIWTNVPGLGGPSGGQHQAGTCRMGNDPKTSVANRYGQVHEGISCAACHKPHSNDTRGSCVTCHPKFTSCNRDVMAMDTTYRSRASKNNIHRMRCIDCHPAGVPKRPPTVPVP